jgi:hypothetical protein
MALQGLRTAFTNRGGASASAQTGMPADSLSSTDGQRLVLDVPAAKAARLVGVGLLAGFMVGGILVGLTLPRTAAPASTGTDQSANGNGNGTGASVVAPVPALAALRGTSALNGRIAARADDLAAAVDAKRFDAGDVVPVLRRLSQDTRAGSGMVRSFAGWPEAGNHQAALATFYDTLSGQIDDILAISVRDGAAYKAATKQILKTLGSIATLDDEARVLAAQAGTDLPPVVIPGSLR